MKALSLHQPYPQLIVMGIKKFETRSWPCPPNLIGSRIALHATAKRPDKHGTIGDWRYDLYDDAWYVRPIGTGTGGFRHAGPLPLGAVVGSAVIEACYPIVDGHKVEWDVERHGSAVLRFDPPYRDQSLVLYGPNWGQYEDVSAQLPYGDFTPGLLPGTIDPTRRYAWLLGDAAPCTERCPWCWGRGWLDQGVHSAHCPICERAGFCDPVPARGRQRIWNWDPTKATA